MKWTNRTHCENSKEHVAVNCTRGQPRGHDGGEGRSPLGSFACWASTQQHQQCREIRSLGVGVPKKAHLPCSHFLELKVSAPRNLNKKQTGRAEEMACLENNEDMSLIPNNHVKKPGTVPAIPTLERQTGRACWPASLAQSVRDCLKL